MQAGHSGSSAPHGILKLAVDDYGQKGWKMTVHNFYDKDKRDGVSLFACIHRDDLYCQEFEFVPVGTHYNIILKGNESGKAGARLTCHRYFDSDKRDTVSTRVCFHPEKKEGQLWDIKLDVATGDHRIVLADDAFQQKGWILTAHRHYDHDKRDDTSTFLFLHRDVTTGQLWHIHKK